MNRLQEVVRQKFRSGSVDSDKSSLSGSTDSTANTVKKGLLPLDNTRDTEDTVWSTGTSQPPPLSAPPILTSSVLADLSIQNTQLGSPSPNVTSNVAHAATNAANLLTSAPSWAASGAVAFVSKTAKTAQKLQESVLSALSEPLQPEQEVGNPAEDSDASRHPPIERKLSKKQPKGTVAYTVQDRDTLTKIGAHFDVTPSELMKLNKMASRNVFAGQTLYVPDPTYIESEPESPTDVHTTPPLLDSRPKVDLPLVSQADCPPPSIPGHVVLVSSPVQEPVVSHSDSQSEVSSGLGAEEDVDDDGDDDSDCMKKFIKMRSRRVLEEKKGFYKSGTLCKGTLLVTPNAIMFDPDVNDPVALEYQKSGDFSVVIHMDHLKSVALFHDLSPRMFWRKSEAERANSPRPEPYHANSRSKGDGQDVSEARSSPFLTTDAARVSPDGAFLGGNSSAKRLSPIGVESTDLNNLPDQSDDVNKPSNQSENVIYTLNQSDERVKKSSQSDSPGDRVTGRTSKELEEFTPMSQSFPTVVTPQPGRASEEVEHMLKAREHLHKQLSHGSELAVNELSQALQGSGDTFGNTRDFGAHMGRSSSEVSRHGMSSSQGRVSVSSPGDPPKRSDSSSEPVGTPTRGFAPVVFTDHSPNSTISAIAAPKPMLPQPGVHMGGCGESEKENIASDLKLTTSELHPKSSPFIPGHGLSSDLSATGSNNISETSNSNLSTGQTQNLSTKSVLSDLTPEAQKLEPEPDSEKIEPETQIGTIKYIPITEDEFGNKLVENAPGMLASEKITKEVQDSCDGKPSSSRDSFVLENETKQALSARNSGIFGESDSTKQPLSARNSSSFSPLRTPVHHISSFFNYTAGIFRSSEKLSQDSVSSSDPSVPLGERVQDSEDAIPRKGSTAKEEMDKFLRGKDPAKYLPQSDSQQFVKKPMYLQLRVGVPTKEVAHDRAIENKEGTKMKEEYWFVVPRDQRDKLYWFIIKWQPGAYGDQEELQPREQFFFDLKEVDNLIEAVPRDDDLEPDEEEQSLRLQISENHFSEDEKTWEIISKGEVYTEDDSDTPQQQQQKQHMQMYLHRQWTEELNLPSLVDGPSAFLNDMHVSKIMSQVPKSMSVGYDWELVFSTGRHGYTLLQLYRTMQEREFHLPVILVLKDRQSHVFGAYLSEPPRPAESFYGSGATFLFTFYPEYKAFKWTGENNFFINGTKETFAVGSGDGKFGLFLDGDLDKGSSETCSTFDNTPLTCERDFHIINLEAWQLIDSSTS